MSKAKEMESSRGEPLVRFALGECSLGRILVARSDRGICAILIGDDADALVLDLKERFPRRELVAEDAEDVALVAAVVRFVEAPAAGFDLPLDLRGTEFQLQVWDALREIPAGTTSSYTEIARKLGKAAAIRAVAGACAANPVAVAVPCHRVVRADGGLAGYRWGLERKRMLLERERAA